MFKKQADHEYIEEQLQNGQIKKYIKGRTLGKGGFAECYEFISQETGRHYAAKVIDKSSLNKGKAKEKLESEIMIHKSLQHKHIVKFQHFFEDHDYVYILLQLCPNNTLNELLKRRKVLTQLEVRYYISQLLQVLIYIHSHRVIHRDLKLGNFFLDPQLHLKVGDFGLATCLTHHNQRRKTVCGTPNYIAPEILEGRKGHSYEVDVWSLGVITYALLFGKPPFETNQVNLTYQKIKRCQYYFPKSNVSAQGRQFIQRMLVLNPANRATVDQLLEDVFIKGGEIPFSLPLSTLACPPSKTFIQQIKEDRRPLPLSCRKQRQLQNGFASSRTSKQSIRNKLTTFEKGQTRLPPKQGKTQRSHGSITRTVSSALLTKKKIVTCFKEQQQLTYISFFQEQPKYGIFYITTSQNIGMRFNDQTVLCCNPKMDIFHYATVQNQHISQQQTFQIGQEKESLQKKVKVFSHFAKLFQDKVNPQSIKNETPTFLLSYYASSNYTLFYLGNNFHQAKFKDNTNLLLDNEIVHLLRKGKRLTFRSSTIETQSEQTRQKYHQVCSLIKRMKKNKQILQQKKQKQNGMVHSSSQAKIIKRVQSKSLLKQISSTTRLHNLPKRVLGQYCDNGLKGRTVGVIQCSDVDS